MTAKWHAVVAVLAIPMGADAAAPARPAGRGGAARGKDDGDAA